MLWSPCETPTPQTSWRYVRVTAGPMCVWLRLQQPSCHHQNRWLKAPAAGEGDKSVQGGAPISLSLYAEPR